MPWGGWNSPIEIRRWHPTSLQNQHIRLFSRNFRWSSSFIIFVAANKWCNSLDRTWPNESIFPSPSSNRTDCSPLLGKLKTSIMWFYLFDRMKSFLSFFSRPKLFARLTENNKLFGVFCCALFKMNEGEWNGNWWLFAIKSSPFGALCSIAVLKIDMCNNFWNIMHLSHFEAIKRRFKSK